MVVIIPKIIVSRAVEAFPSKATIARSQDLFRVNEEGGGVLNNGGLEGLIELVLSVLMLWDAFSGVRLLYVAGDVASKHPCVVPQTVLWIEVARTIAGLCKVEGSPIALSTPPILAITGEASLPHACFLVAAPHLSFFVEDYSSAIALRGTFNAKVSTSSSKKIRTSIPGMRVCKHEEEEQKTWSLTLHCNLKGWI